MSLNLFDRVKETCSAPGTGTVTLLGAVLGFQSFSSVGNANTCYYTIADQYGANWEVGIGTYTLSGTTLARTTVLSSSAGGTTKANFSSGTQDVFVTYPAEKAFSTDMILNVVNGGTGLATLTAGYIPFGNGTSAFGSSASLTFNGNVLTVGNGTNNNSYAVNGLASGTAGGADLNVQNNGTTIIDIGNYSRIFGGVYNAGAAIYAPSTINYYIGSASAIFGITSTGVSTTGTLSSSGTMTVYNGPTWNAAFQVVQTPACSISTLTNDAFFIGNAYYDSVGWKYTASKPAGYYTMNNTASGDHSWATAPSGTAGAALTWTERMRLFNSGGLSLGNTTDPGAGNLRFNTTNSNGIYFGSSSLLADYEEGTWSPTLTTATGSLTYANQGSNYIKIGHMVLAYGYINVSAVSAPTGQLTIGGLPFTNQAQYGAVTLDFFGGTLTSAVGGYIVSSSTTMVTTNFNSATISAGGNIMFTAMYKSI